MDLTIHMTTVDDFEMIENEASKRHVKLSCLYDIPCSKGHLDFP